MTVERLDTEFAEGLRVAIAVGGGEPLYGGEAGITLATRLEWFLDAALRQHDEWSRYRAVDGFFCSVRVIDTTTVEAAGAAIWIDGRRTFVDPAWMRVRLSRTLPQVEEYEVRFGDASSGVGRVGYADEPSDEWPEIAEWEITVRGAGYPAAT